MWKTRKKILKIKNIKTSTWSLVSSNQKACILCRGWTLCPREPFPVVKLFLLFLSIMKLPSLMWTQCSNHRIPGSTNTGSFLYPVLSRNFVSWRFPPCFQFGWSWPAGTEVIRWEEWQWHDQLTSFFSLVKLAKKMFIYVFPMAYKSDSGGEPTLSQNTKKLRSNLG